MPHDSLHQLRHLALEAAGRSRVPYSARPSAVVLLLEDGSWIPGVRVESASFSLTIPPLLNAWTTAVALERTDVVAVAASRSFSPEEVLFMSREPFPHLQSANAHIHARAGSLPLPASLQSPFLEVNPPPDAAKAVELARDVSRRAYIPESQFPVGCILGIEGQKYIPGVNVENEDWSAILCAERNALGTAISYGYHDHLRSLYLSCPLAPGATPCGACRQLLAELAPAAAIWMDQGDQQPQSASSADLLPAFFSDGSLRKRPRPTV